MEKIFIILAPSSIRVSVVADASKYKAWRDKNLSGSYNLFEFYNERPVYKVSFILSVNIVATVKF